MSSLVSFLTYKRLILKLSSRASKEAIFSYLSVNIPTAIVVYM